MSRRAIQAINWAALAEMIPESERAAFTAFKAKSDQYLRRMTAYPETAPKIDWEYYRKNIAVAGMVDNFRKQYEAVSIPYPPDNYTAQIDAEAKNLQVKIQEFIKQSDEHIAKVKEDKKKLENTMLETEMTMEEYWEAYPEQATNVDHPSAWPHTEDAQPDYQANLKNDDHH